MNRETVLALNEINRQFYRTTAREFSASRRSAWPGFERVVDAFREIPRNEAVLRILDVGCGNARFVDTLLRQLGAPFHYLGIDASPELLAEARRRHGDREELRFRSIDFVKEPLAPEVGTEEFSGIVLFGVLHHVPGAATRRRLLEELACRLHPGGLLAVSVWRFGRFERFRRRFVPWAQFLERTGAALDPEELEPGDYLLPFGRDPSRVRYCHALDRDELARLLDALPLTTLASFHADGRSGNLNRYVLLRRRP
jgi:SAM-dependent methyltransferase